MTDITPKYFDHPDFCIRFLEWRAIQKLVFGGRTREQYEYFDEYSQRWPFWLDHYSDKKTDAHDRIMLAIHDGTYENIDDFYKAMDLLLKPKPRGKALKDKKRRTAQSAFQRENLGEAFIDNPALISAAKACAYELSEARADATTVRVWANELAIKHSSKEPLTDAQIAVLNDLIKRQLDKHQKPDSVESKLIDEGDKNLYFMWGKIKRRYPVNDTFVWPTKEAAKICGCSKSDVKPIMNKLQKLGAITCIQKGAAGQHSKRASIYRREV